MASITGADFSTAQSSSSLYSPAIHQGRRSTSRPLAASMPCANHGMAFSSGPNWRIAAVANARNACTRASGALAVVIQLATRLGSPPSWIQKRWPSWLPSRKLMAR